VALSNLARQNAVVVVLDDVHLADSSSWEALAYLVHNLPEGRLLIVAARGPWSWQTIRWPRRCSWDWSRKDCSNSCRSSRSMPRPSASWPPGLFGGPPPQVLVDWLSERSRGNPLFALGLLQALIEEKADLAAPVLRRVPEALADRLGNRPDRAGRAGAGHAGTIGGARTSRRQRRAGGDEHLSPDRLDETLSGLLSAGMVLEEWRGYELTWEIVHPLIQQVIYERIGGGAAPGAPPLGRSVAPRLRAGPATQRRTSPGRPIGAIGKPVGALCEALRQAEQRETEREAFGDPRCAGRSAAQRRSALDRLAAAMSWRADWIVDLQPDETLLGVRAMREMRAALARSPDLERGPRSVSACDLPWVGHP